MKIAKKKLIQKVRSKLTSRAERKAVKQVVDALFDTVIAELKTGNSITIDNFGRLEVVELKERIGQDFNTRQPCVIPARKKVRFKQSANFWN